MANRSRYALMGEGLSRAQLDGLLDEAEDEEWDILSHYDPERFDRRAVNRRLAALGTPFTERRSDEAHRSDSY